MQRWNRDKVVAENVAYYSAAPRRKEEIGENPMCAH